MMTKARNLTHQDETMKYFGGIKHTSLLLIYGKVSSLIKAHSPTFKDLNVYLFKNALAYSINSVRQALI
jgi:hypothetical protein